MKFSELKKNEAGLVPVVTQDYRTNEVLMVAYMNEEAFNKTLETKQATYFSRSRNELWIKGQTSGHVQWVKSLFVDCDSDTLLLKVKQEGAACHTGAMSCFYQEINLDATSDSEETTHAAISSKVIDEVYQVVLDRKKNPKEGSYTNYLFDKGVDKILKKVGEETAEVIIGAKNPGSDEIVYEISDLLYHLTVLLVEKECTWEAVFTELGKRR
jgi:phosphoribosyl-AMP cyclohydrolase / phosphoribosyl-ATP pyrophosphohydrolase